MLNQIVVVFGILLLISISSVLLIANEQRNSLAQKRDWQQQEEYWPGKKREEERWLNPASTSLSQQRWALISGLILALLIAVGLFFVLR